MQSDIEALSAKDFGGRSYKKEINEVCTVKCRSSAGRTHINDVWVA
jgi:hypothetical protein